jgi:hypothetical protein
VFFVVVQGVGLLSDMLHFLSFYFLDTFGMVLEPYSEMFLLVSTQIWMLEQNLEHSKNWEIKLLRDKWYDIAPISSLINISMKDISRIVNYDRIYGSLGLYIPVGIDPRNNVFCYFLPRTTKNSE